MSNTLKYRLGDERSTQDVMQYDVSCKVLFQSSLTQLRSPAKIVPFDSKGLYTEGEEVNRLGCGCLRAGWSYLMPKSS